MSSTVIKKLSLYERQCAIDFIKKTFINELSKSLNLHRVSAPLFVETDSGLNDNLSGTERPVEFDIPDINKNAQIVHSLAKWKRYALHKYDFPEGEGLYTDMNAIRRDEHLDSIHSVYVDQWDWELIIKKEERNLSFLKNIVTKIVNSLCDTNDLLKKEYPSLDCKISREVYFITTQQLEDLYPDKTPKERERLICKEHRTVFLMQIGKILKSGKIHDSRAPDYDDWELNGDILIYNDITEDSFEVSSMGIRVDGDSLISQLDIAGCNDRLKLPYHNMLINNELPLTIGGGIGQSRICMLMMQTNHIGEVQSSLWDNDTVNYYSQKGIILL